MSNHSNNLTGFEVAVIGISIKAPGAKDINDFWSNLKNGKESIKFYSDEELIELGVKEEIIKDTKYVKAQGIIEDKDCFDSNFFNYLPDEAKSLDPQIRKLSESVYAALEDAGCNPYRFEGRIGIYVSAAPNFNWEVKSNFLDKKNINHLTASQLSKKDFISTLISYKLNLKGPSEVIDTACSSSLVAINRAYKSLLLGESNIAVAGGVTLSSHKLKGYHYEENSILSPDGHCRSFDSKSKGTVASEGIGVVILKRLRDAIKDKDHIYALVKGGAVNNDGNRKVGFTAPSIDGQIEVIKLAQKTAKVEPKSISYIEAHGTATELGDPIEIKALKNVFKENEYCDIGSVKSNIGHTDRAAGVIGFIKAALCLKYKQLVPSLHFKNPNPKCGFENSPFHVNTKLKEWKNDKYPLRAGVTSLGIGGTNAHIVLEEAPEFDKIDRKERKYKLIVLSAKTASSLEENIAKFINHLETNEDLNIADIAFTLQVGRHPFNHRLVLLGQNQQEIVKLLKAKTKEVKTNRVQVKNKRIVFMFPGQGSQYVNMGLELYEKEIAFRQVMDQCIDIANKFTDCDLRKIIFNNTGNKVNINNTKFTQPILFIFEYALAQLLIHWGIKPDYMIGHSIGEYVAATISGVLKLEEALKIVALRGKLMQELKVGSMLSISISKDEIEILLKDFELDLAAVNSSKKCVVSGEKDKINEFKNFLTDKGYECKLLQTSHAFHSSMMIPMLKKYDEVLKGITFSKPEIPYFSNVTGKEVKYEDISNSEYWCNQIRKIVQFSDSLDLLLADQNSIFIEVGPGNSLSSFVSQHSSRKKDHKIINIIRHPKEDISDQYNLINKIGDLWLNGKEPNWENIYEDEDRRKVALPTYSFDKTKYQAEFDLTKMISSNLNSSVSKNRNAYNKWFYLPTWKKSVLMFNGDKKNKKTTNIIFHDIEDLISSNLENLIIENTENVISVLKGNKYEKISDKEYLINPQNEDDYIRLFKDFVNSNVKVNRIIHCWSIAHNNSNKFSKEEFNNYQYDTLYSLKFLTNSIRKFNQDKVNNIVVISNNIQNIFSTEKIIPAKSLFLPELITISQEFNLACFNIDIDLEEINPSLINNLYQEIKSNEDEKFIAYRKNLRWIRDYENININNSINIKSELRKKGLYLITGGLGNLGYNYAKYLMQEYNARVLLIGRTKLPLRKDFNKWLDENKNDNSISLKILKLLELEKLNSEVSYFNCDIKNYKDFNVVIEKCEKEFGSINGVIHAAGNIQERSHEDLTSLSLDDFESQFESKVYGLININEFFKEKTLDFIYLTSTLSTVLGGIGYSAYAASNTFMDYFANNHNGIKSKVISVNYDGFTFKEDESNNYYISLSEANNILEVALKLSSNSISQIVVTPGDLNQQIKNWVTKQAEVENNVEEKEILSERPEMDIAYEEPNTVIENELTEIWKSFFGLNKIGIEDDFFDLGGDSLKAMTLLSLVHKIMDVNIPVKEIFKYPTVKEMALFIEMINLDKNKRQNQNLEIKEEREIFEI